MMNKEACPMIVVFGDEAWDCPDDNYCKFVCPEMYEKHAVPYQQSMDAFKGIQDVLSRISEWLGQSNECCCCDDLRDSSQAQSADKVD